MMATSVFNELETRIIFYTLLFTFILNNLIKLKQLKLSDLFTGLLITTQKIKFSIKHFFKKCDQIRSFQRNWPH